MIKNTKFILIVLIALSILMGAYESFLYSKEMELTLFLGFIWGFIMIILLVLWVDEDSKNYPEIYKPFEFGFLVFIFYIPYIPYYLIKTRGAIKGILYLIGFVLLFQIGWFFSWLIYLVSEY